MGQETSTAKVISFQKDMNFYYTKKEKIVKTEGQMQIGVAMITGHTKELLGVGDVLNINNHMYKISEVIEVREPAGVLSNEKNKGKFFHVQCDFTQVVKVS